VDKAAERRGWPATTAMAPMTFLNRYQQEGEFPLGQGTYGVVYKARDLVRLRSRTHHTTGLDALTAATAAPMVISVTRRSRDAPWP